MNLYVLRTIKTAKKRSAIFYNFSPDYILKLNLLRENLLLSDITVPTYLNLFVLPFLLVSLHDIDVKT